MTYCDIDLTRTITSLRKHFANFSFRTKTKQKIAFVLTFYNCGVTNCVESSAIQHNFGHSLSLHRAIALFCQEMLRKHNLSSRARFPFGQHQVVPAVCMGIYTVPFNSERVNIDTEIVPRFIGSMIGIQSRSSFICLLIIWSQLFPLP